MTRKSPETNDLAPIIVGARMEHFVGSDRWVPVTIIGIGNGRYVYQQDGTGRQFSCLARQMRARSRFRPIGPRERSADVVAVPVEVPRVETLPNALRKLSPKEESVAPMPEDLGVPDFVARGRGCVVVADVEHALAYSEKSLSKLIRGAWSTEMSEGRDFDVLTFWEAKQMLFGGRVPSRGTLNPRGLMVLYETGFDLVLQKTDKPEGQRLRRRLADEVLPKLRRGEPVQPVAVALSPAADARLDRLELTIAAMGGVMQKAIESIPALVAGVVKQTLPALLPAPASPPAPAEVLPIGLDWMTSEHIAHRLSGRTGSEVTKHRVDKIIREETRVRDNKALARTRTVTTYDAHGGEHRNPQWWYAPEVIDTVAALLDGDGTVVGRYRKVDGGAIDSKTSAITDTGRPA